jgi:hypothetical protein
MEKDRLPAVVVAAGLIHRLVDLEGAAVEILAIEGGDGGASLIVRAHFDKSETLGLTGIAIRDDLCGCNSAVILEQGPEPVLVRVVAEVSYVNFLAHGGLPSPGLLAGAL